MSKWGRSAALLAALTISASGQSTLTLEDSAPIADLLISRGDGGGSGGGSSQATFGFRNNAAQDPPGTEGTRGRGQSFVINSIGGATYDISSLAVSLANSAGNGSRPEGDLALTIFEYIGTGATAADQANDTSDWTTKTGGTSGAPIFSGSYEVAADSAFGASQFLTISFDPGTLQLDDDKAYGFFFQYTLDDVTGLGSDISIAFDADLNAPDDPVGRLLNTVPDLVNLSPGLNGTSDTRDLNYFITGNVPGAPSAPTISASASLVEAGSPVVLDITFDPTVDSATLTTPGGPVDLVALDDGATNGDPVANDGMVTVTDFPSSTFTYEVVAIATGFDLPSATVEVLVADPSTEPADNAFSTAIKGDSPLFYYRFEEPAESGYLLDSSGNSHHASNFVGQLTQGGSPGGMQIAGRSDGGLAIQVPASSEMSASFTAVTVLNVDNFGGTLLNVIAMANGSGNGRSILYYGDGSFQTFISGTPVFLSDGNALPDQTSCLVHMVYDADPDDDPETEDQEIRIYVNGELFGSPTAIAPVVANLGEWVLCSNKNLGTQSLVGWIDETAVFETDLSDLQIAAHGTSFFAAADPMLGFDSDSTEITEGNSATLTWKISDQATAVTINGESQTISGGGLYTTVVSPTEDTIYTLEVTGPGGPFTKEISVTVSAPPAPPRITSISIDDSTPPMVTLTLLGEPGTTYNLTASATLVDGFPTPITSVLTNGEGLATTDPFEGLGDAEFYRFETLDEQ